jgi:MoxR-like ATPase
MQIGSVEDVVRSLQAESYLPDRGLATAIFLALQMRRPLLLEGEAGVGKTEVGKTLARMLGARLIRLQCYEGIDAAQALYEWDYARQLLYARTLQEGEVAAERVSALYGPDFLVERPLLAAIRAGSGAVLLIDELDRADDEFEAFLLEVLSDFTVTVPEPLARSVAATVARLRSLDLVKLPGAAEAIDWAQALSLLDAESAEGEPARATLGWAVKNREDTERVEAELFGE